MGDGGGERGVINSWERWVVRVSLDWAWHEWVGGCDVVTCCRRLRDGLGPHHVPCVGQGQKARQVERKVVMPSP